MIHISSSCSTIRFDSIRFKEKTLKPWTCHQACEVPNFMSQQQQQLLERPVTALVPALALLSEEEHARMLMEE